MEIMESGAADLNLKEPGKPERTWPHPAEIAGIGTGKGLPCGTTATVSIACLEALGISGTGKLIAYQDLDAISSSTDVCPQKFSQTINHGIH